MSKDSYSSRNDRRPNTGGGPKRWTGSRIKSDPYVSNTVADRRGGERKRSVDEMLRILKKRLAKSGIPEAAQAKREFTKRSKAKRAIKKDVAYRLKKRADREKELDRLRDLGK
jgi:hypothetical protein